MCVRLCMCCCVCGACRWQSLWREKFSNFTTSSVSKSKIRFRVVNRNTVRKNFTDLKTIKLLCIYQDTYRIVRWRKTEAIHHHRRIRTKLELEAKRNEEESNSEAPPDSWFLCGIKKQFCIIFYMCPMGNYDSDNLQRVLQRIWAEDGIRVVCWDVCVSFCVWAEEWMKRGEDSLFNCDCSLQWWMKETNKRRHRKI